MKTAARILVLLTVVIGTSVTARASTIPIIQGQVAGLEFCTQDWCGKAAFTGIFVGRIGFNPFALGTLTVTVNHGTLPDDIDECTPLFNGDWILLAGFRKIVGEGTGELCYVGDNRFHIDLAMEIIDGGTGLAHLGGILDHNFPIPQVTGRIVQ